MKKAIMMLIIVSALLMGGCPPTSPPVTNYFTGTEGVTIRWLPNLPPDNVYEDTLTPLQIEIHNKGAMMINETNGPLLVTISFDPFYIQSDIRESPKEPIASLYGKSDEYRTGEKRIYDLGLINVTRIKGVRETPETQIDAVICYPYRTILSQAVCIDRDIYQTESNPVCKNIPEYSYSGQGAPIVITRIESQMLPSGKSSDMVDGSKPVFGEGSRLVDIGSENRPAEIVNVLPSFRIHFRNDGTGIVLTKRDSVSMENICFPSGNVKREDVGDLKVTAKLGNEPLVCEPATVKMFASEASTRCALPRDRLSYINTNLKNSYQTILTIEAEYVYLDTDTKKLKINRVI